MYIKGFNDFVCRLISSLLLLHYFLHTSFISCMTIFWVLGYFCVFLSLIEDLETSITRFLLSSFSKDQKVKYLSHLIINNPFFSESSYIICLLVLLKANFYPTPRRTFRTSSRWSSTKINKQNFIKDKMSGRVDILWRIFEKIAKKLKMKSQERKNVVYGKYIWKHSKIVLYWVLWLKFNFFVIFFKMRQSISTLPVI